MSRNMNSGMPKGDARFAKVVRGDFNVDAVADADANEVLAHLARNMCEYLVTIGKRHAEHCSGKHLGHRAFQFNRFFFRHSPDRLGPWARRHPERGAVRRDESADNALSPCSMPGSFGPASKTTVDIVCEKARVLRDL